MSLIIKLRKNSQAHPDWHKIRPRSFLRAGVRPQILVLKGPSAPANNISAVNMWNSLRALFTYRGEKDEDEVHVFNLECDTKPLLPPQIASL